MSVPEQERPPGRERIVVVEGGLQGSRFTEILVPILLALLTTLLAGMITAGIAFGSHISGEMDRLSERISHNGERISRIEGILSERRVDSTPPAPQKNAQRR